MKLHPAEIVVNEMLYSCTNEIAKIKERIECYISNTKEEAFSADTEVLENKYELIDIKGEKLKDLSENEFRNCSS